MQSYVCKYKLVGLAVGLGVDVPDGGGEGRPGAPGQAAQECVRHEGCVHVSTGLSFGSMFFQIQNK